MTPLEQRLRRQFAISGPITLADYWAQCLFDTDHGYYTTRVPIGAAGDFTTAPEISQMFGELIAAWWLATARQNGKSGVHLVEIGPGRGTLMADMTRTLARLDPTLKAGLTIHMVETSPRLIELQREKLAGCGFDIHWHTSLATLPKTPLGIIANELFDAIPVRALVKHGGKWMEQAIAAGENDELQFVLIPVSLTPSILPGSHETQVEGAVYEYAPAREGFMADLSNRLHQNGGFGLFIDYGHAKSSFGDTVQAMKDHKFVNVLSTPGEADITSHVDFESLANIAKSQGLTAAPLLEQGEFLNRLGIEHRAESLALNHPSLRDTFETACERLTGATQMGKLFKVLAIASQGLELPGFDKSS